MIHDSNVLVPKCIINLAFETGFCLSFFPQWRGNIAEALPNQSFTLNGHLTTDTDMQNLSTTTINNQSFFPLSGIGYRIFQQTVKI